MVGPPRLVLEKKLLDLVYIHPGGVRTAMALFFVAKCHLRNTLPSTHEPWQGLFSIGADKESQCEKIPANNNVGINIVMLTSTVASIPPLCDFLGCVSIEK